MVFNQQIFLRNIGIFDTPIIEFETKEQFIEFVLKLDKIHRPRQVYKTKELVPYFILTNSQCFPNELAKYKLTYVDYPLNEYNISILYSLKHKFYNVEQPFIEWMEKYLSKDENEYLN